jgi:hypothetical protein
MMKKLSLFFLLLLLATSCAATGATKKTTTSVAACPVFYTGKGEPAASDMMRYNEQFKRRVAKTQRFFLCASVSLRLNF